MTALDKMARQVRGFIEAAEAAEKEGKEKAEELYADARKAYGEMKRLSADLGAYFTPKQTQVLESN